MRSTIEGCASEISNEQVLVISGDLITYNNKFGMLYPVPAREKIFVSLAMFSQDEYVNLTIWDISGKNHYQNVERGGDTLEIDISQFYKGLYLIKVTNGQNPVLFKFIKE